MYFIGKVKPYNKTYFSGAFDGPIASVKHIINSKIKEGETDGRHCYLGSVENSAAKLSTKK